MSAKKFLAGSLILSWLLLIYAAYYWFEISQILASIGGR